MLDDPPGERFQRQYDRLQHRSPALRILIAIAGGLLVITGIAFLILPGPGLPLLIGGLGLLAGLSRSLARSLDRAEPAIRSLLHRVVQRWHRLTSYGKALSVAAVAAITGGIGAAIAAIVL